MSARRPSFLEHAESQLLLFGGKGGVGKTTSAAAAALFLARRFPDRSFLLASTDPAHSLCDSLADAALPDNLHFREIDFRASLEQFKQAHARHLREIALRGTILDEEDVGKFLDLSIPGFDELMAFHEISALLGKQAYSCIILDTAPTGHTLRFLEMPDLMRLWIDALDAMLAKHRYLLQCFGRAAETKDETDAFLEDLGETIRRLGELLENAAICRFVPVMLAETLSTRETSRLVARLKERKIAVRDILVNRLHPPFSECTLCRAEHGRQRRELHRIAREFAGCDLWGIPLQGGEVRGGEALARFWEAVEPLENAEPVAPVERLPLPAVEHPAALPDADLRLLLFAGKGGVGKTTLACATATRLAAAFPDKEVLLFSTDPAHSLSDCLSISVGPAEVRLGPRLTALEIDPAAEFEKLKTLYAREVETFFRIALDHAGMDMEFDRAVVESVIDLSPPGLDEMMALLRVVDLLEKEKYHFFVLDTAPTGHLVRLLELPEIVQDWLKTFFGLFLKYKNVFRLPRIITFLTDMSKRLKRLRSLLADPRSGRLYAVSILTEMAREETCDLLAVCRRVGIHVPVLFLNQATPATECPLCSSVARTEATSRRRFLDSCPGIHQTVITRGEEPRGLERLTTLGEALYSH